MSWLARYVDLGNDGVRQRNEYWSHRDYVADGQTQPVTDNARQLDESVHVMQLSTVDSNAVIADQHLAVGVRADENGVHTSRPNQQVVDDAFWQVEVMEQPPPVHFKSLESVGQPLVSVDGRPPAIGRAGKFVGEGTESAGRTARGPSTPPRRPRGRAT